MKKIITLFGFLAVVQCCVGQGTVGMANNSSTLVYVTPGNPVPSSGGRVEFLWAPAGTTDYNLFQTVPGVTPTLIAPIAGRFSTSTAITIPGIAPGAIVSAFLRGWTGSYLTWTEAVNSSISIYGYSAIFRVDTGDPTAVPAGTPGNIVTSIPGQGFPGMVFVPEPSSLTLLGLGSVAMIFLRRRR